MVNKNANNNNLSYILNDNQRISNYYGKYKDMTFHTPNHKGANKL